MGKERKRKIGIKKKVENDTKERKDFKKIRIKRGESEEARKEGEDEG